ATTGDVAAAVARAARDAKKPVVAAFVSAEPVRLPGLAVLPYPESAARALALAWQRTQWLRRDAGEVPELDADADAARAAIAGAEGWIDPRALLAAYGIPLVQERTAANADEAVSAARELGFPAVVKTAAPGAHKSESGGVALDLRDEAAVRAAVERIGAPVLVQPHLTVGTELLAGIVQDPTFGPLVAFGPGGVYAELIGEAAFRLAPLTDADARELVESGKAGRLVRGFRGTTAADADALVDLLLRLGRLAHDIPEIAELDLNPVLALPHGCLALDARVRVAESAQTHALKSW
ncbi:MAG TPA: acetate--CoA ligase family protein, partial [Candidatus Elarobacter sp.]|nr:acetate--CoA ligase family protein [Candidatus Elarobacter sp.]